MNPHYCLVILSKFMLSYNFSHKCWLIPNKKFCNCINLFPCIFVGFIYNGFSIKWWKFDQDSWRSYEKHMQEGEQSGQVSISIQLVQGVNSRLTPVTSDPWSFLVLLKIMTFHISITHTIYTLIIHKNGKELIKRKTLREVSITHPPY